MNGSDIYDRLNFGVHDLIRKQWNLIVYIWSRPCRFIWQGGMVFCWQEENSNSFIHTHKTKGEKIHNKLCKWDHQPMLQLIFHWDNVYVHVKLQLQKDMLWFRHEVFLLGGKLLIYISMRHTSERELVTTVCKRLNLGFTFSLSNHWFSSFFMLVENRII